ncbi:hypothetical protein [Tropicimonas sp. S265A]|uniref:hypothetical protein n=1 Tax=Tropicimonas sp. S265A TaxID=3415134 RepID=UPI003C7BFFF1
MPQVSRFLSLISATLASALAITAATGNRSEAQASAAEAYRAAQEAGTIEALEEFIESYPLSDEASDAFSQIVVQSRGSELDDGQSLGRGIPAAGVALGSDGGSDESDPY